MLIKVKSVKSFDKTNSWGITAEDEKKYSYFKNNKDGSANIEMKEGQEYGC